MALTNIQQNILSRIQALAAQEVKNKSEATLLSGMWANEFSVVPTTQDLQAYPPFAHITTAELTDAAAALVAINTTRGEFSTAGSNVVKLLKIVDGGR
jgi:hypothetical protein